jgi:hypothetical protein
MVSVISHDDPPRAMSVTEHVHEAWQLLINLPDGERERVTEQLAERYAWSGVEADTTAMRKATLADEHTLGYPTDLGNVVGDKTNADDLTKITALLTRADVGNVRTLVEALRNGVVTMDDLHGVPDGEWMNLIASRRVA